MNRSTERNALFDPDKNVRHQRALQLGTQQTVSELPNILEQLSVESDFFVRETLIWAIVRMGQPAIEPTIALLGYIAPQARLLAAQALGKIGDPSAVPALLNALPDDDLEVKRRVIYSLGQLGDARALPALLELLLDSNSELKSTVTTALREVGQRDPLMLSQGLQHAKWQVREQIADVLGLIGDVAAVPSLERAIADPHEQVRFAVLTALGHLGQVSGVLSAALQDSSFQVRTLAAHLQNSSL